jgi:nucleotide-binding universal stress UspA family protein
MRFAKKVVIAISLNDDMVETLRVVKHMDFLKNSEVHLVNVFNTVSYAFGFGEFPLVYPVEADRKLIEQSVLAKLVHVSGEIVPESFEGKLIQKCLFSDKPKERFCDYVNDIKADLVIVAAREKRGLFESSFAQYVGKNSKANILTLK